MKERSIRVVRRRELESSTMVGGFSFAQIFSPRHSLGLVFAEKSTSPYGGTALEAGEVKRKGRME